MITSNNLLSLGIAHCSIVPVQVLLEIVDFPVRRFMKPDADVPG